MSDIADDQSLCTKGRNRDTAWNFLLDNEWVGVKRNMERWLYQSPDQQLSLAELNRSKP